MQIKDKILKWTYKRLGLRADCKKLCLAQDIKEDMIKLDYQVATKINREGGYVVSRVTHRMNIEIDMNSKKDKRCKTFSSTTELGACQKARSWILGNMLDRGEL